MLFMAFNNQCDKPSAEWWRQQVKTWFTQNQNQFKSHVIETAAVTAAHENVDISATEHMLETAAKSGCDW